MEKQYNEAEHVFDPEGAIYLGIPRERITFNQFLDNRDQILEWLRKTGRGVGYFQAEGHRVDRNRDRLVMEFLNHPKKPEWLYMIDTDMEHLVDEAGRLTRHAKPIVGGLYFHRGSMHDPFCFRDGPGEEDRWGRVRKSWTPMREEVYEFLTAHKLPLRDGAVAIDDCLTDPLWAVDAVATGSIVIHRSVLEHMPMPVFEYRALGHSEDLMFCWEAKHLYGIQSYCDVSTIAGHYNWVPMGQAQFRQVYESRGFNLTSYNQLEAIRMWSEFFKVSKESAKKALDVENPNLVGPIWNKKPPQTPQEVNKFYRRRDVGRAYLVELLHWNASHVFNMIRNHLIGYRHASILEIGAGIGTVTCQLAIQRNEVVASEINPLLREFIEYRYNDMLDQIESTVSDVYIVSDEWRQADENTFDAVVAIDVMEHLSIEALREIVPQLVRVLKPGGRLFTHNNWEQQDLYPMHFKHEEIWNELMQKYNFLQMTPFEAMLIK